MDVKKSFSFPLAFSLPAYYKYCGNEGRTPVYLLHDLPSLIPISLYILNEQLLCFQCSMCFVTTDPNMPAGEILMQAAT